MSMIRLTLPSPSTGVAFGVAGIKFTDGVAVIDTDQHPTVEAYALRHGYTVERVDADESQGEQEQQPEVPVTLAKMTVADLRDYAERLGVKHDSTMKKADLIAVIDEHRANVADPEPTTQDGASDGEQQAPEPGESAAGDGHEPQVPAAS